MPGLSRAPGSIQQLALVHGTRGCHSQNTMYQSWQIWGVLPSPSKDSHRGVSFSLKSMWPCIWGLCARNPVPCGGEPRWTPPLGSLPSSGLTRWEFPWLCGSGPGAPVRTVRTQNGAVTPVRQPPREREAIPLVLALLGCASPEGAPGANS